jgi:Na+:H+ antiporter, NhaA family
VPGNDERRTRTRAAILTGSMSRISSREGVARRAESIAEYLREERSGGRLLLLATAVALLWANLAGESYRSFWATTLGPTALHLDLSLHGWAADGLLAIFFYVAGIELKRELVAGELADRRAAALPVFAAVGGMVVPALVAIAVSGGAAAHGGAWAIPVATDIAFALGVLALARAALPSGVRVMLLSIAVVDDLLAIALIAAMFTSDLSLAWLAGGLAVAALWVLAFRLGRDRWFVLVPLAAACWVCIHASGVHATVAGILLALLTPVEPAERLQHRVHPVSAGVAVPVFAVAAAGIPLAAGADALHDSVAIGVFAGLLAGKVVGILGGARLAVVLRLGALPERVAWADVLPVAVLGGIGYTVSLLIAGLSLPDVAAVERSAAAVLAASVLASVAAVVLLRRRGRSPR